MAAGNVFRIVLLAFAPLLAGTAGAQPHAPTTWADVQPLLSAKCVICHSGETAPLGLALDSLEAVLKGSQRGPVVTAGAPGQSELLRRLTGASLPRMPMTGPPFLSDEEVVLFEQWIRDGLPAGDAAPAPEAVTATAPKPGLGDTWSEVAPIFARRCVKCHTDGGLMGAPPEGYRLNAYEDALSAADRARIVPFNPDASELLRKVRGQSLPRMPLDGPPWLDDDEIALVERWIRNGAMNSAGTAAAVPVGARIRLRGTLRGPRSIDGLDFEIPPGARVDDDLRLGVQVDLRGVVGADGRIRVSRIKD